MYGGGILVDACMSFTSISTFQMRFCVCYCIILSFFFLASREHMAIVYLGKSLALHRDFTRITEMILHGKFPKINIANNARKTNAVATPCKNSSFILVNSS